jgi:AmmeMemoRadiSam system protein B
VSWSRRSTLLYSSKMNAPLLVAPRCCATIAAHRTAHPALAGAGYPADAQGLWNLLQEYLESSDTAEDGDIDWSRPVGLLSPHIDYGRGGAVYAHAWKRAAQAVREAELVILLGTDHYGLDLFTLTRQSYATPYGVLPTDTSAGGSAGDCYR